jgi:hypothetical protein
MKEVSVQQKGARKCIQNFKNVSNLCEDRTSGSKTMAEFLRGVSYNIRGGQPNM